MVNEDDLIVAARRKLLADPKFSALIGVDVGKDLARQPYSDGWVFQCIDSDYTPDRNPRNTGKSAVVLGSNAPWTSPNRHNTLRFPELYVRILSDSTRGADKSLLVRNDARARCHRVADVIRSVFNDVGNVDHYWTENIYVISSVMWTDIRVNDVINEDSLVSGNMSFALELG